MSRKKKKLINQLVDDQILSGPAPDAELTIVDQDMFWLPDGYVKEDKTKQEVKDVDDPLLNIL